MAANIAVVSFDRFLNGDDADRRDVAKQVYDAFTTMGWVYLKDHGIRRTQVDEIFDASRSFFSLPLEDKLKYRLAEAEVNQGYTADGAESVGGTDHKESYEHRRYHNASCPSAESLPGFRQAMDMFYLQCMDLGRNVLKCLALAMDLEESYFDAMTAQADPQLRVIHYPAISREAVEQEGHARIRPHTDYGFCTLLFQDAVGGLEVDALHTGQFQPAPPIEDTVLINIADLLQRLTNDRCRSTLHRVVSPRIPGAAQKGEMLPARYSIAFFIHPDAETMIDPITLQPDEKKKYPPINAGAWRVWKTQTTYGFEAPPELETAAA